MKKLLLLLSSFALAGGLYAAPGDTTTVSIHQNEEFQFINNDGHTAHWGNYDQETTLPDGSVSYNKILLEFELGKYACDGYSPNNPGEGPNQTGWCGDWDYDVHVRAINSDGVEIELGRLITPYANHNFPRTPLEWRQSYFFDVTNLYPFLKDDMTLRIFYSGYSGGFTGTTKLHFIEGPRHRDVLDYQVVYQGSYAFGNDNNPINDNLEEQTLTATQNADHGEVNVIITGHGGDNTQNCAEFCSKYYDFTIGDSTHRFDVWRDDCGSNFLYPQSGTWVYDRANWCPGDQVYPVTHPFGSLNEGDDLSLLMQFQNYTAANPQASYKISAVAYTFSALAFEYDAGIEAILSPTLEDKYFRYNPSCGQATISVKNYGAKDIESLEIKYTVNGQSHTTTWNGLIKSLATQEIVFSLDGTTSGLDVNSTHDFTVEIVNINGEADENTINNTMSSTFEATPKWNGGDYEIKLKTSTNYAGRTNRAYLKIYDENNEIVHEMNNTSGNSTETSQIWLANGCYKLEVDLPLGLGFRFFSAFTMNGAIDVMNLTDNQRMTLSQNDFGGSLTGNVGNGFIQHFEVVNSPYEVSITEQEETQTFTVYPNPASDFINVEYSQTGKVDYVLYNIIGQEVIKGSDQQSFKINTSHLAAGTYILEVRSNQKVETHKINIQ